MQTLQEHAIFEGATFNNGVIKGVKVLGRTSKNGRAYTPRAISDALKLYEGAKVNIDHPERAGQARSYRDRIGILQNVREEKTGVFADLRINPKQELAEAISWDAEHSPESLGLSHHVRGRTRKAGDKVFVEEITSVQSVDLVADPATTVSLFEGEGQMEKTVKELLENVYPDKVAILKEMEGEMPDAMGAGVVKADKDDPIKTAIEGAILAAFRDESLDGKATVAKIKTIIGMYDKLETKQETTTPPEGGGDKPKEEEATEGLQQKVDTLTEQLGEMKRREEVHNLIESCGHTVSQIKEKNEKFYSALFKVEPDEARVLLESQAQTKPISHRPSGGADANHFDIKTTLDRWGK